MIFDSAAGHDVHAARQRSYAQELAAQIAEKDALKSQARAASREGSRRELEAMSAHNPFGRPGAGAPPELDSLRTPRGAYPPQQQQQQQWPPPEQQQQQQWPQQQPAAHVNGRRHEARGDVRAPADGRRWRDDELMREQPPAPPQQLSRRLRVEDENGYAGFAGLGQARAPPPPMGGFGVQPQPPPPQQRARAVEDASGLPAQQQQQQHAQLSPGQPPQHFRHGIRGLYGGQTQSELSAAEEKRRVYVADLAAQDAGFLIATNGRGGGGAPLRDR
ncbi:hypothetical protein T492DRAFT_880755 [Pavlovales sp. CCMP2436]|nr:hypothetical protein T492DRAFT_880755 [Pavlovales sp. CCMP2436]